MDKKFWASLLHICPKRIQDLFTLMAWPSDAQRSFSLSCGARISLGCRHCWFRGASQHNWKRRDDVTVAMCFPIAARDGVDWSQQLLTLSLHLPRVASDLLDAQMTGYFVTITAFSGYSALKARCTRIFVKSRWQKALVEKESLKISVEDAGWKYSHYTLKTTGSLFFWELGGHCLEFHPDSKSLIQKFQFHLHSERKKQRDVPLFQLF